MTNCEIKLYRGYANRHKLIVFGHVVKNYPHGDHKYTRKGFRFARTILQLFSIKTIPNITVSVQVGNLTQETVSQADGYFRIEIPYTDALPSGWQTYQVTINETIQGVHYLASAEEEFFKPFQSSYGVISDIDDTFLISHSRRSFKKLYVLLSKNVQARKPFSDVVKHYQLLASAGIDKYGTESNIFFYVSSSEWNLYDMIVRFCELNGLPKAILKLKKIKSGLDDFIMTGGGNHQHKQKKIENIIRVYPELKFILLGDDSQKDPDIYQNICEQFPKKIRAVYLRQTRSYKKRATSHSVEVINQLQIDTCYFAHSQEAIAHSLEIGIITGLNVPE
jgi:phosphatidate phosphatase APP1